MADELKPIDTAPFRAALKSARGRFKAATERRQHITQEGQDLDVELGQLRRTITALSAMCSELPGIDELGITDSVEQVMESAMDLLTTLDVVKALEAEGFDFSGHQNATASVHAVLSRLAMSDKIEKTSLIRNGKSLVAWQGPKFDPDNIPF